MPDGNEKIAVKVLQSVNDVPASAWDACADDGNPFVSHGFLSALEDSGSASAEKGWLPQHLAIEDAEGRLVAAAPAYLKNHSYGEYVFDWGWADAWERAGGQYYPKLQSSVPFTPVTGPRLLARPGGDAERYRLALAQAMVSLAGRHGASSAHITFCPRAEWDLLGEAGLLQRRGVQYHWHNDDYEDFEAFLATLMSRKRKQIRKERRAVADQGIRHRVLRGDEITEVHWDTFHDFYLNTVDKRWGQAYLTRDFFSLMAERLGERVVLIVAEEDETPVAAALNLLGDDALYGRNWGCLSMSSRRDYRFLHFETCYYQAIDFAIAHRLARVEAGAQGEHKIQRGYLPVETYSAHWLADPRFAQAVADFLLRENRAVDREIAALMDLSPYRQAEG